MKQLKTLRFFFALLLGVLFQAALASTTITGNVSTEGPGAPSGPIAGAFVMVSKQNVPNQILASAQADASGNYTISGLAAGNYEVQFSMTGYDNAVMNSYNFKDNVTSLLNAQMVPSLSGTEVPESDVSQESQFTITNPNSFSVSYQWQLPGAHGTATAPPGNSVVDTKLLPHTEEIQLYVDNVEVQPAKPSSVKSPVTIADLSGVVLDKSTGLALGGVQVNLTGGSGPATVYTLSDGSFIFYNEQPAGYKLTYTLAGYNVASENFNLPSTGGQAPTMFLTPTPPPPTANVAVTVLDTRNAPITNVTILIAYSNGATYQATTNGNGVANFTGQPIKVHASITATTNDGSGRTGSASTSGFSAGSNSVRITLPAVQTGAIKGTVTNASNSPLSGVTVVLLNASNTVVGSATTASNGTYTISGVIPGTYTMTFSLTNYVTGSIGGVTVSSEGTTTENMSLVTVASTQAIVVVTVTDGGSPAVGASVSIAYANGTNSAGMTTNSNGQVTFSGQPAGILGTVTAVAGDGSGRSISSSQQSFPAGVTTTLSLALPPLNNAVISGQVQDITSGQGIPYASVNVTGGATNSTVTADASGNYSVGGLGLQTYALTASASGYLSATYSVASNTVFTASLYPENATANVTVQDTFGNPISGTTVELDYPGTQVSTEVTTGANGVASFQNQLAGYDAVISATTSDNRTASSAGVFTPNSTTSVTLTVTSDYGILTGNVQDALTNQPIAGASVAVVDFNNNLVATETTDGSGNYVARNLVPGTYTLTITALDYQPLTLTAQVVINQSSTQNAALSPALGSVTGQVTGSISQSPVPGAQITLNGPASVSGTTDSNGSYSFNNIRAGNYTGTLTSGIFTQSITVTITPNQTTTANLILDTTSVAGRVVDQNNNPLADVTVTLTGPGFNSSLVVTDQFGNYVVNRESNSGPMTITASYSVPGGGNWTTSLQINVSSTPPENVISPIVLNIPCSVAATVTVNGNPVSGASVSIFYTGGTEIGPVTSSGGVATFNTAIINNPATVSAQYVDGTGTVYVGTVSNQTFGPGSNAVALPLSLANAGQSGNVNFEVVDQNGNPLAGAQVTISYSNGDTSATLTSDSGGNVTFPSQQVQVSATVNATWVDGSNNSWTGSRSFGSGFLYGNNNNQVVVTVG